MRLVYLYGPPSVGKLSVGMHVAALTGFKLLHNHLSVNLVGAVFERDSPPWQRMLARIRRDLYEEAAREGVDLVATSVFLGTPESVERWRSMFVEPVTAAGGQVLFVQLTCPREELFARVQNESRVAHDKLTDPVRLAELLDRSDLFARVPFEPNLCIDTSLTPPEQAAEVVVERYELPRR